MKKKSIFMCKECGHESPKWLGRCPGCGEWNTFIEQAVRAEPATGERRSVRATPLSEIAADERERMATGVAELDRVLGGGIVTGVVALVGGDPGIGKSTLLLQASGRLASQGETVLYVSAEESRSQLKLRAKRLGIESDRIIVVAETDLSVVLEEAATAQAGRARARLDPGRRSSRRRRVGRERGPGARLFGGPREAREGRGASRIHRRPRYQAGRDSRAPHPGAHGRHRALLRGRQAAAVPHTPGRQEQIRLDRRDRRIRDDVRWARRGRGSVGALRHARVGSRPPARSSSRRRRGRARSWWRYRR